MSKRTLRSSKSAALPARSSANAKRAVLWLGGLATLLAVLATVYFWPLPEDELPTAAAQKGPPLQLPTVPEKIAVEQLQDELRQTVAELLEKYPDSVGAHRTAATMYQFFIQYEVAEKHWERCIELSPDDSYPLVWLAKIYMKQGEDDRAIDALNRASKRGDLTAELFQQYGMALQRAGKVDEATEVLQQGLDAYPHDAGLWSALGQSQLQTNALQEAKASFESALKREPKSLAARLGLASACARLGESEQAAEHHRLVEEYKQERNRTRRPFEEEYEESMRHTAATVLAGAAAEYDAHGDAAKAERLCLRACGIDPVSPPPYRQLANMYYRQKRLEDALVVQRRLAQVEPDNAVNFLNLATLALQMGHVAEGEAALREAGRRHPADPMVQRALASFFGPNPKLPASQP